MEPECPLLHLQVPANFFLSWAISNQSMPPHPTSCRSILILSSHLHLGFPSVPFPSGFPTRTLYTPLPHMCYMPYPSHSPQFDHPINIGWGVQIIKFLIMYFSPLLCYLVPPRSNTLLSTLFSNTLSLHWSLSVSDQVSHPYKTMDKITALSK